MGHTADHGFVRQASSDKSITASMSNNQASTSHLVRKTSILKLYRNSTSASQVQDRPIERETRVPSESAHAIPTNGHSSNGVIARRHTFSGFSTRWAAISGPSGPSRRHTSSHVETSHVRIKERESIKRSFEAGGNGASESAVTKISIRKRSTQVTMARN